MPYNLHTLTGLTLLQASHSYRPHTLTGSHSYRLTLLQAHTLTGSHSYRLTLSHSHTLTSSHSYRLTLLQAHTLTGSHSYRTTPEKKPKAMNSTPTPP